LRILAVCGNVPSILRKYIMALYTGKGDFGTTKIFDTESGTRISKTSNVIEALGSLDELNSFLGLAKVLAKKKDEYLTKELPKMDYAIEQIQQNLFTIQAEVAGAEKRLSRTKVTRAEEIINALETEMPPITTFFISGGTELATLFDYSRTLARQAERRVVALVENRERGLSSATLAYLNRLSSLLYALARFSNHKYGIKEESPNYK